MTQAKVLLHTQSTDLCLDQRDRPNDMPEAYERPGSQPHPLLRCGTAVVRKLGIGTAKDVHAVRINYVLELTGRMPLLPFFVENKRSWSRAHVTTGDTVRSIIRRIIVKETALYLTGLNIYRLEHGVSRTEPSPARLRLPSPIFISRCGTFTGMRRPKVCWNAFPVCKPPTTSQAKAQRHTLRSWHSGQAITPLSAERRIGRGGSGGVCLRHGGPTRLCTW
ncbi:hypothetical protein E4U43_007296 [Claviceps pusilla]|uniref:Uncharacterized protein n=1 Tax=Claviceps pusilla TaxID=123648 RepID=A0A9P7ND17_9HYPO|nr:hypothetical protein E4U43_007296 [Claviceps pusilla]